LIRKERLDDESEQEELAQDPKREEDEDEVAVCDDDVMGRGSKKACRRTIQEENQM
jgi:hypothetical protein